MAGVAGLVSKPAGMRGEDKAKRADAESAAVVVVRRDPDAVHRTGSLRDLFELCRQPGKAKELKAFLKVSPHLCRRTIVYGKMHSFGIGWYPCYYPGSVARAGGRGGVSSCAPLAPPHPTVLTPLRVRSGWAGTQAVLLRLQGVPGRDAVPCPHRRCQRGRPRFATVCVL